jgi:hypothetical protein
LKAHGGRGGGAGGPTAPTTGGGDTEPPGTQAKHAAARRPAATRKALRTIGILPGALFLAQSVFRMGGETLAFYYARALQLFLTVF